MVFQANYRLRQAGCLLEHRSVVLAASCFLGLLAASCRHNPKDNIADVPGASASTNGSSNSAPASAASAHDAGSENGNDAAATSGGIAGSAAPDAGARQQVEPSACNEQRAQDFLVNAHFNGRPLTTTAQLREWKDAVARSIRYRTEQYGYFTGFGNPAWNAKPLRTQLKNTKFFGRPVRLHERIIPALACVEQAIERECAAFPYHPQALAGIRDHNTYLDGDVTNHAYGIAIDIDPMRNPCCGCIKPWNESPRCKGKKTEFERMDMPACWVPVFERYGFYWLGHDALRDTMHFEFLGDPEKIVNRERVPATSATE